MVEHRRAVEAAFLGTLYVLFFIEIGTRRVHVTVSTTNPDSSFVTQQARNLVISLADEGAQIGFLIPTETPSSAAPSMMSSYQKGSG